MLRDFDITPSLPGLLDKSNRELAATIFFYLRSTGSNAVGTSLRPSFYARLGGADANGMSQFTERITLDEILEQIMEGKSSQQIKDNIALTHCEHATDELIPAKISFQANPTALGQAFYHMDRYELNNAEKATHEMAARDHILNLFGRNNLRGLSLS
jgi:hypothetical protein